MINKVSAETMKSETLPTWMLLADNDVANYGFQVNRYTADFVEDAEELSDLARKGNGTALCEFEAGNFRAQTSKTGNEKKCCGLKGYINDKGEFQNPARGWIHKMTSNSCPKGQCIWDYQGPRFLAVSRTVAIKLEDLPRAFMMIRKTIRERCADDDPIWTTLIREPSLLNQIVHP